MKRLTGVLVLSALLAAFIACEESAPTDVPRPDWYVEPCQDWTCDSQTVRYMLDTNGFDMVTVEFVADTAGGRISSLGGIWYRMSWTVLPPQVGKLVSLETIAFVKAQLTSLPPEIGNLVALVELYLDNNSLTSLPPEIGNLVALEELYLSNNSLTSLPPEFGNLISLRTLLLGHNNLVSLPACLWNLVQLEQLSVPSTNLASLPPEIGNLVSLHTLFLNDNNLTGLPPEIANLASLSGLFLDDNNLTSLPPEIGNLGSLWGLEVNDNNLVSLPSEIGNLVVLGKLELSGNNLTSLPQSITSLSPVDGLRVCGNHLTNVTPEVAAWLDQYAEANWRDCQGGSQEYTHDSLVVRAILDSNGLDSVAVRDVTEIAGGRAGSLRLDDEGLTVLSPEIGDLVSLRELGLSGNDLTNLPVEITTLDSLIVSVCNNHLANATPEVAAWLDQYAEANWRDCQGGSQEYTHDSLVVRAILDSNGLDSVAVRDVTEIGGRRVERLEMDHLGLTVLPPEIGNLALLRVLWLSDNNLTSLPPEISSLGLLEVLYFYDNDLTSLPPEITSLDSYVGVCENHLTNVTPEVAAWLDQHAVIPNWRTCQTPGP